MSKLRNYDDRLKIIVIQIKKKLIYKKAKLFHIKRKKEEEEEENPIFGTKHDKYKIDIYRLEYNSAIGKGISKIAGKNKSGEKNEK